MTARPQSGSNPADPPIEARPEPKTDQRGRGAPRVPPEFGGDPVVWAAWLYYEDGLNQNEVAARLGVSRATGPAAHSGCA